MLLKLKHKLIAICIISTTLIVSLLITLALNFSERQLSARNDLILKNNLLTIVDHLQDQVFSYVWLAQMESTNHMIIDISTHSVPISFPGSYITDSTRHELIALSKAIAQNKLHYDEAIPVSDVSTASLTIFPIKYKKGHYSSLITSFKFQDTTYQVLLIHDLAQSDQQIIKIRCFFIGLTLVGIGLLGLFSSWFVKKAIKPIEISQKEQTDFVAAASHELRSPLAVIYTLSDDIIREKRPLDIHFVQMIMRECSQLTRLVNDLLFLARSDSGYWQIITKPIELDTLLLDIYDSFLSVAENHHHSLDITLPNTKQSPTSIDSERITQAISVLINNAISHTPSSTQITLSLENIKGYSKISVIDNGPGIPDDIKPHIFKRFYRADQSRHDSKHYGLGLNVAFEIAKLHHGKLSVEDTPGGGTTFVLLLPNIQPTK